MPLLDHFHPPLSQTHPWSGFHSAWANSMALYLNQGVLPDGFHAIPNVELGGPVEIDVATIEDRLAERSNGAGLSLWTPPAPGLTLALDFPDIDVIEVRVYYDDGDPRLIAAVELVSPSNKDRPSERRAFSLKCASYLHQGTSVVIVDVVTSRRAHLHEEILRRLGSEGGAWRSPASLYAVAYRATGDDDQQQLEIWPEVLPLNGALPVLPLWIGTDISVPLDLETTYQTTCVGLRVPVAKLLQPQPADPARRKRPGKRGTT